MEIDVRDGIEYWISIPLSSKNSLYNLRDWNHLKIGYEQEIIWIRGFDRKQVESVEVLSLAKSIRYYLNGSKLFLYGKRLPTRLEPIVLWTPIQRALKLNLPEQNLNYFGLDQKHQLTLIPSSDEQEIIATITSLSSLNSYVSTAPFIRLKHFQWTVIADDSVLLIGKPMLPIIGKDFYQNGCFLIPAGWKLKNQNMANMYESVLMNVKQSWYIINTKSEINKLNRSDFVELTKGSVQRTIVSINNVMELLDSK